MTREPPFCVGSPRGIPAAVRSCGTYWYAVSERSKNESVDLRDETARKLVDLDPAETRRNSEVKDVLKANSAVRRSSPSGGPPAVGTANPSVPAPGSGATSEPAVATIRTANSPFSEPPSGATSEPGVATIRPASSPDSEPPSGDDPTVVVGHSPWDLPTPSERPSSAQAAGGPAADPLIGLIIADRYRIIEQIGRGGMGIVYRVEHTHIGKLLAMKLLAGELSSNKEVVRRFKQEAMTVSKLSNRHTVQVFDYGVWQHLTFLVMELVEGRTLARTLRRSGPMLFARLGRLMVQVCSSLSEAHGKGIVHRDIKPENIMIVPEGDGLEIARVLDFGLAKLRESSELNEVTLQGAVVGTPYYISPEQILSEPVDGRTDIYSLGAVMFRALTGAYPFRAKTPMAMFNQHLTAPPPCPNERCPDLAIPRGVAQLVTRCLQKKPEDRVPNVEQLRTTLLEELDALGLGSSDRVVLGDSSSSPAFEDTVDESPPPDSQRPTTKIDKIKRPKSHIATRDEVEAYQRKLRRTRFGAWALLGALGLGGAIAVIVAVGISGEQFSGIESEPNNVAAEATPIPLDTPVEGLLGKRVESAQGDRDFFVFEVPDTDGRARHVSLSVTALPNVATCSILYRIGFRRPLAQFCMGRPGQDLLVPALLIEPGGYFVAVLQDRDPYGRPRAPYIHENVSDWYRLQVSVVEPQAGAEIEPNDQPASAVRLAPGQSVTGMLAWMGDVDFICAIPTTPTVQWEVDDGARKTATVLEVTPTVAGVAGPQVRIHAATARPFGRAIMPADVNGPWTSPPVLPSEGDRCLQLKLVSDPWVERRTVALPRPDHTRYVVKLRQLR